MPIRDRTSPFLAGLLLVPMLAGSGCAISGGVGLGLGAEVHLSGLLHTGLIGFSGVEVGSVYGMKPGIWTFVGSLGLWHGDASYSVKRTHWEHVCNGLLPGLLSTGTNDHPWAFEVGVAALFFHARLGFDPEMAWRILSDAFRSEKNEEPGPVRRARAILDEASHSRGPLTIEEALAELPAVQRDELFVREVQGTGNDRRRFIFRASPQTTGVMIEGARALGGEVKSGPRGTLIFEMP